MTVNTLMCGKMLRINLIWNSVMYIHGYANYDTSGRRRKQKKPKGEVYKKYKPQWQPLKTTMYTHRSSDVHYPSAESAGLSIAARPERQEYTGTLVKGISTMHKSNAVPIIDEQEAKDHASMRR